jgi:hypothetical protein
MFTFSGPYLEVEYRGGGVWGPLIGGAGTKNLAEKMLHGFIWDHFP